jgi:hypothetical protein
VLPTSVLASLTPTSSFSTGGSFSHRRRRSSASSSNVPSNVNTQESSGFDKDNSPSRNGVTILPPIPGTPNIPMTLSRSPSPRPGGGWASPGLSSPYVDVSGRSSPAQGYRGGANGGSSVTWESAKAKSEGVNGYPSFSTQNNGFFNRHYRNISNSLPSFNGGSDKSYAEKEKLGRGRWMGAPGGRIARLQNIALRTSRKTRLRLLGVLAIIVMIVLFYTTRKSLPFKFGCIGEI